MESRGDARKTAVMEMSVWFNEQTGQIHLATGGQGDFISTVSADPASTRGNPNLYWKLAAALRKMGMPAPDLPKQDAETLDLPASGA